ncbi:hypothetical protein GPECTOR_77g6 [Gonium pectorale]|uniref:BACK domain-containing protein n=1 Tax=Gonium pectorale TaxID=33097 RepID=A0A150G257_GONPE|nr:hypothetical protein GPECTOR_77g6 [Gonium pectorale]|eukprot:KXZ43952.1 hypothetical protein GPECTOR_77g6 [Gonium pectorale]
MAALLNPHVSVALATRFGSDEDADCSILFVRSTAVEPAAGPDSGAAPGAAPADGSSAAPARPGEALAKPFPAHKMVLRAASGWFKIKLDYKRAGQLDGDAAAASRRRRPPANSHGRHRRPAAGQKSHTATAGALDCLTVLRVQLGSATEVPAARAAIRFAYTGAVEAGSSVREVLELYRQGQYLQVEGCGTACIAAIEDKLNAVPSDGTSGDGGADGSGASSASSSRGLPSSAQHPLLELFSCGSMWPDDPAFCPVLSKAKSQLVSHFGDAITALNTPELRQQLLALPAEGLEVLLESDDFGTDVEDTILLLLATWVQRNGGRAGAVTVERLCRLVRLAQLSPGFAEVILPALPYARWFPVKPAEAINLLSLCTSAGVAEKRRRLMEALKEKHDPQAPWFSSKPRRQCLASGQGRTFEWTIREPQLCALQPGSVRHLVCFDHKGLPFLSARGFEWFPVIEYDPDAVAAGVTLYCELPSVYGLEEASLGGPLAALAQIGARLEVDRWIRKGAFTCTFTAADYIGIGGAAGLRIALPLRPLPAEKSLGGGKGAFVKYRWADYLWGGKVKGRVVLVPLR